MADNEEKKPEEQNQEQAEEKASADVSPKLAKIVEEIEQLSVLELSELVSALQEKFGVSAMPAAAPAAAPSAPTEEAAPTEEKATATVVLANAGSNKIGVIKALREINQQLGLKEAKDLAESAPKEVVTDVKMEEAQEAKKKLEEAGATVELK